MDHHDYRSLAEWQEMKKLRDQWPHIREKMQVLEKRIDQLTTPPLQYGIYLGPGYSNKEYLIVGVSGMRIEVCLDDEVGIDAQTLAPGQLLMLNQERNVVDVRPEYVCGETAEVLNVIKGEEEAEVLSIIADASQQTGSLYVRWREKEEIKVECRAELLHAGLKAGDIVQLDQHQRVATARVKPRLHVKVGGNEGAIVEISDRLLTQGVRIGDMVRIEQSLKFAFEKLPVSEMGKLTLEEVPDVTYDDIGGLDEQIGQIYDAIEMPYLYREQFNRYQLTRPKGILLYGPPGCGKTMVAKAVANSLTRNIRGHLTDLERFITLYKRFQQFPDDPELITRIKAIYGHAEHEVMSSVLLLEKLRTTLQGYDVNIEQLDAKLQEIRAVLARKDGVRSFFLNVKGPELLDKYVGETERSIRRIFEEARRRSTYYTPVIIFFDEMEAMFRTRGAGRSSDVETTIVPQFLAEIDGLESTENLIVIGASNRQEMIDSAILRPGRLDVKVKIDRPSRRSAQDIFAVYLLPTLPLSAKGLTLPTRGDEAGEIIFRTCYKASGTTEKHQHVKHIGDLLPRGCDLRLAYSLSQVELQNLAALSLKSTLRDAITLYIDDDMLRNRLARFDPDMEIGELIQHLCSFHKEIAQDHEFAAIVEHFLSQEWIAETMILQTVNQLYSSANAISILTRSGSSCTKPLKAFMSGATIASIVNRAKRQSIKRGLREQRLDDTGIRFDDLYSAIKEEFEENKDQLAYHNLKTASGKTGEEVQSTELHLTIQESNPWSEEKIQLYKKKLPRCSRGLDEYS
jgi:proteasome-associated ATPase